MKAPAPLRRRLGPGRPWPLGATWTGDGVNFALFSANAERVELCLFSEDGTREIERIELFEFTDQVRHLHVGDIRPGQRYGYRVYGPYDPEAGHRFNPAKLLLDPYAKKVDQGFSWTDAHYGFRKDVAEGLSVPDKRDNAPWMLKAIVVVDDDFDWGSDRSPNTPLSESIIYEAHIRGFTRRHPGIPHNLRGSFAAFQRPETITYLKDLGITAVEFLPVNAFVDDHFLVNKGLRNFWGYQPLSYFAPMPRYLSSGKPDEMKRCVRALHAAGIEVILDVVFNHTMEGNADGPTLSFRGIDNASYYRLNPERPSAYLDDTGCGNMLDISHPAVLQMVMDSLRHWVTAYHVDGFRFDLASTLGREARHLNQGAFDPGAGFFDAIRQDPILNQVKLIAEPWDIGPGGYRLGGFPPGWGEWNDQFRDKVRGFWHGHLGHAPKLAASLAGSAEAFDHNGRRPSAGINLITAHDGFTLADLVSYDHKHNHANGEANRDGHNHNLSHNHGAEGPSKDAEIQRKRARQQRNFLASLFFSQGTPLLLGGDEFGRTQHGNNNAYCQDNELAWVNWRHLIPDPKHAEEVPSGRALHAFTRRLIALRKRFPALRQERFLHGRRRSRRLPTLPDLCWINLDGRRKTDDQWQDPNRHWLGMLLAGDADPRPYADHSADDHLLILANGSDRDVTWRLPDLAGPGNWTLIVDTARPDLLEAAENNPVGNSVTLIDKSLRLYRLAD